MHCVRYRSCWSSNTDFRTLSFPCVKIENASSSKSQFPAVSFNYDLSVTWGDSDHQDFNSRYEGCISCFFQLQTVVYSHQSQMCLPVFSCVKVENGSSYQKHRVLYNCEDSERNQAGEVGKTMCNWGNGGATCCGFGFRPLLQYGVPCAEECQAASF